MIDLNELDSAYAHIQIANIRKNLNDMLIDGDGYKDSEIVNIGLEIFRILIEISTGVMHISEDNEREWDSFFEAQDNEENLIGFIHDLKIGSKIKNELLDGISNAKSKNEIYEIITKYKESYNE